MRALSDWKSAVGWLANVRSNTSHRGWCLLCGVAAAATVTVFSGPALGDTASVFVDYEAAPTRCPDANAFRAQLQTRRSVRWSEHTSGARRLIVRIEARDGRYVGGLTVREVGGPESEREVVGNTCAEVVSGLAFVAALAIDPGNSSGESPKAAPPNPSEADPSPSSSASSNASSSASANGAGSDVTTPPQSTAAAPSADDIASITGATSRETEDRTAGLKGKHWHLALGVGGQVISGPAPNVMFAVPVFIDISSTSASVFSPSARLHFERASSSSTQDGTGGDFTWTEGGVDLCPIAWSTSRTRVEPCLRTEVGVLRATGLGIEPARGASRIWMSIGPALHARWRAMGPVFVDLSGSLDAPLVRDRFFVEPNTTVFLAPPVEWSATLALGVTLL
jgi:hypothetical protein